MCTNKRVTGFGRQTIRRDFKSKKIPKPNPIFQTKKTNVDKVQVDDKPKRKIKRI